MARLVIVFGLCLAGLCPGTWAGKWSYEGQAGPANWHQLFPQACSGAAQSPIDIKAEETLYDPALKDFALWYDPPRPGSRMFVMNNGHTLQVNLEGEFYVSNGGLGHVYKAAQFHFHWGHKVHVGSEHLMEGRHSPIEMHLVTYNQERFKDLASAAPEKGGLAVLGVMFEVSEEDNPAFDTIVRAIKHIRDPEVKTSIEIPALSLRELLPKDIRRYYRYDGSLTTPNCFESVTWTVFEQKQTISHRQLKEFRSLLQFRRHAESLGERHRRSASSSERHQERQAEKVLDELGIQRDHFQQAVLRAKLGGMVADQPLSEGDMHGHQEVMAKADKAVEISYKTVAPTESALAHEHHGEHDTPEMILYEQDILVNNFRPVQPLNERVVHRSFKLRPSSPGEGEGEGPTGRGPQEVHCGQLDQAGAMGRGNTAAALRGHAHITALAGLLLALLPLVR